MHKGCVLNGYRIALNTAINLRHLGEERSCRLGPNRPKKGGRIYQICGQE